MIAFGNVRRILKPFLAKLVFQLRLASIARRFQQRDGSSFQILIYHKVSPAVDPFAIDTVACADFERQMAYLSKNYSIRPLDELIERSPHGEVPENAVAITFDDGYQDLYHYAFPILKKYNVPATIFLVTGFIDTPNFLWFDRVLMSFRNSLASSVKFSLNGVVHSLNSVAVEDKRHLALQVLEYLKYQPPADRDTFIENLAQELSSQNVYDEGNLLLSWRQIQEMSQADIAFGPHTVNHSILTSIPFAEAQDEIAASIATIEEKLQKPSRVFAYPNGSAKDFNDQLKRLLKNKNFKGAVTTIAGNNTSLTDTFELRRGRPWESSVELFAWQFLMDGLKN